jgi:hypothetical protein
VYAAEQNTDRGNCRQQTASVLREEHTSFVTYDSDLLDSTTGRTEKKHDEQPTVTLPDE